MSELQEVLSDLVVLDLGMGMAPALVTNMLVEAGATIIRVEPVAGDPFYNVYPAYRIWHGAKEIETISDQFAPRLEALLAKADVCVVGGEDYPGTAWRFDAETILANHPDLVILNITGYPTSLPFTDRPASEILVQAKSGFCFEQYSERPSIAGFAAGNYGAAMLGLTALLGALYAKWVGGTGQIASVSLFEGVLSWCVPLWLNSETQDKRFQFILPKDPHPLIFRCKDGKFIHFVLGSAGSKGRIYRILKIDDPTVCIDDSGFPSPAGPVKYYFGDVDTLATHVANFNSDELVSAIAAAEVAVEYVLPPGECWSDPQVLHNAVLRTAPGGEVFMGSPITVKWKKSSASKPAAKPAGSPLGGVRVLDFGSLVAGPYGTALLADLGADVIKVEPLTGDVMRAMPRNFISCNRGKRSIAVDMKSEDGAEIVRRLCLSSDAVTNNFRPGVSARLGVDPDSLQRLKPGLIVLETTGYGSSGPSGQRPGYDMVLQAFCGFEDLAGGEGNPPVWDRTTMLDYGAGLCGAAGLLMALIHRQRSGAGASISTCLLNAGLFMLSELIKQPDGTFTGARKLNHAQTGFHPAESVYQTADNWIAIHAPTDTTAQGLLRALYLATSHSPARADWGAVEYAALGRAIRQWGTDILRERLDLFGVWSEPVLNDGNEWLLDQNLKSNHTVAVTHDSKYGDVTMLGQMFRLSGRRPTDHSMVPSLGANSREILLELGFSKAMVDDFYARKIVA